MSRYTEQFTEVNQFANELPPANRVAGAYGTSWLAMQDHYRAVVILKTGVMATTSTIDLIIQEAQDIAGTGVQAIAGKAITQLDQALGDSNDLVLLELRTAEMDVNNGYNHIRVVMTIANAASFTDVLVVRFIPHYPPVPTTVLTEIVP